MAFISKDPLSSSFCSPQCSLKWNLLLTFVPKLKPLHCQILL